MDAFRDMFRRDDDPRCTPRGWRQQHSHVPAVQRRAKLRMLQRDDVVDIQNVWAWAAQRRRIGEGVEHVRMNLFQQFRQHRLLPQDSFQNASRRSGNFHGISLALFRKFRHRRIFQRQRRATDALQGAQFRRDLMLDGVLHARIRRLHSRPVHDRMELV